MSTSARLPYSVLFFGTPVFSCPSLKLLCEDARFAVRGVVTQPDRPAGRGKHHTAPPVKEVAEQFSLPLVQPVSLRRSLPEFLAWARTLGPIDIGVVVAFGQILPEEVLSLPRHGCINVHASLLPRWRGAAPIQRAILAGDKATGVCLMRMEAGLDTGPVFSSSTLSLNESETFGSLHDELSMQGAHLLRRDLVAIIEGKRVAVPQPTEGITYATKISPAECQIDWSKGAVDIERMVRAFNPSPGAFSIFSGQSVLSGKRVKLLKAAVAHSAQATESGIISLHNGKITVQCGDGQLELLELQLEGKRSMPAIEFLRGYPLTDGEARFELLASTLKS